MLKLKFKLRTSGDMCSIIKMITTWDTHCCTYVFRTFFSVHTQNDENSHQLIHSRLGVWSALMLLVGFMSNERFVHVWMNEWIEWKYMYSYIYSHIHKKEKKSLSEQKSSPSTSCRIQIMFYAELWYHICIMNFFLSLTFWLCFLSQKISSRGRR